MSICWVFNFYKKDCCDGSDEFKTDVNCKNDCFGQAKEERDILMKELRLQELGIKEKENMIKLASTLKPKLQKDFDELQSKVDDLNNQIAEAKIIEDQAEELNNIAKEIHDSVSEEYVREDEGVDDEDFLKRAQPERVQLREDFLKTHGKTTKQAIDGLFFFLLIIFILN